VTVQKPDGVRPPLRHQSVTSRDHPRVTRDITGDKNVERFTILRVLILAQEPR